MINKEQIIEIRMLALRIVIQKYSIKSMWFSIILRNFFVCWTDSMFTITIFVTCIDSGGFLFNREMYNCITHWQKINGVLPNNMTIWLKKWQRQIPIFLFMSAKLHHLQYYFIHIRYNDFNILRYAYMQMHFMSKRLTICILEMLQKHFKIICI